MNQAIVENLKSYQVALSFLAGIMLVIGGYALYEQFFHTHDDYTNTEVHVHADFLMYLNGERVAFSDDKYQSSIERILHPKFHFHDNDDHVIHRHDEGLTLAEFLESLGYTLTNDCITTDSDQTLCSDDKSKLLVYVNGVIQADVRSYIPQEEDRILIYFGAPNDPMIESYLSEITDESCIYSGTCPERGTPPPESCGITCEL